MAIDKKSDHVGNHGGSYTDENGMSRQFTYIDHDRNISRTPDATNRESNEAKNERLKRVEELKESIAESRRKRIDEILAMPAVSFLKSSNTFAEDCIIRDIDRGIIWDETFVRGLLTTKPDMIYVMWISVWKNTVKEQNWDVELSHEEILDGKWTELM